MLQRLALNLDRVFPRRKILIVNIKHIMWVAIRAYLATHILACIFLIVDRERFDEEHDLFDITAQTPREILEHSFEAYVDAFYFMVMTQTTVGYGSLYSDLKKKEMFYIMAV